MIDYSERRKTRVRLMAGEEVHWVYNSKRMRYIRQVILSTPPWLPKSAIRELHEYAARNGLVLDHIVPLNHPNVCGLTVPWNLVAVHPDYNQRKGNDWNPEGGQFFHQPDLAFN